MGSRIISRALVIALWCAHARAVSPLSAAADDNDCALYLTGPGRTSAYDYSLNLLKGNFGYEGQHTCITYDAVNQAYLEARNRIVVSQPKGDWKPEDYASVGELILDISINLARRYGLTYEEIEKGLPLIDTSRTLIREVCPPVFSHVECRPGKYRRLDGLCTNPEHPTWGSTNAPFQRLIGPLFADGINAPRISHTGRDLPLSRVVSRTMHPDEGFHDHAGTVMVIAWGQFMDHDYTLTGTPLDPINRNDPEECCKRPLHLKHPYCNEIRVPDDDYFYRLWGVKCIDFVRGFPSPRPGCRLGSRVPFNTLTGVIDGNTVYGVTDKFARKLRTGYGGLLRMNPVFKEYGLKDLLPLKLDIPDEGCTRPNKNMYCFEAGEIRVNEQLVLTVMHTLMAREHNRVAHALAEVNPHWDDETLYQESRRINIAEIQHITYNEFLPILLGKDVMEKFGLVLEKQGYWEGYDPNVNPDVIDAFAAAAYRFGHSLLPTAVERWSKAHKFIASKRLSDLIRRPYDLYRAGVLDEYVMGLMNQVAQAMDDSITQEVTNHLFKKIGARFGMDLVSFNMQRGREFGLPGYMEFRKFCGLSGADSFQDLFGAMSNDTVRKYETIFEHPIDVDLWSGGVSERPLPGSMLGPTFACVIATQFSYSRRGDRFWFELPNQPSSFTPEQLAEIRKSRLARVICDNTDIIDTVQLYPMVLPDHELNPRVPCRSGILPSMDFSKWAEPTPFAGSAKQFMTDAIIFGNCTQQSGEGQASAVGQNCGCAGTAANVAPIQTVVQKQPNIQISSNDTSFSLQISVGTPVQQAAQNIEVVAENCTACLTKPNEIADSNTVLKYVYKKDEKVKVPIKTKGHAKNSLRKKRALNKYNENARYAESSPLIVNYKLSHPITFERHVALPSSVRGSDLADFSIETLHANEKRNKNSEKVQEQPRKDYFDAKFRPKSRTIDESSERDEYHDDRRNKPYRKSDEKIEFIDDRRNRKPYRENEESDEYREERKKIKPYREESSYEKDENIEERRPYRESSENDDRGEYRGVPKNNKPPRENDESDEIEYRNDRKSKPYRESSTSEEKGEYRDDITNIKPNRESDESDERENYRDDRKNNKPYKESVESDEREEYHDDRKINKPYKESGENNNRGEYRDERRNSKPYRESDESEERGGYQSDRRNTNAYPKDRESQEKENYHDERKPFRDSGEIVSRNKYRDDTRNGKPSHDSEESSGRERYQNDRSSNKPYSDSGEHDEKIEYKTSPRGPQRYESREGDEDNYSPRNKASYSTKNTDSGERRENIPNNKPSNHERSSSKETDSEEIYKTNEKSAYTKPRDSGERDDRDYEKTSYKNHPERDDRETYYEKRDKPVLQQVVESDESGEEEAIIAIMKRKHRKPNANIRENYDSERQDRPNATTPLKIKDVDLDDFSYERIQLNNKGLIEPVKDTHESQDNDALLEVAPLKSSKPDIGLLNSDVENLSPSGAAILSEISEIFKPPVAELLLPININDGEVKPVIEINSDIGGLNEDTSKEELKAIPEVDPLEAVLGVKIDSEEKNEKIVEQQQPASVDVKQQFERIPLNYKHNNKKRKHQKRPKPTDPPVEPENEDDSSNEGTIDELSPKRYDENLKIKFDDVTVKLPEIKLPEDILSYAYEKPGYDKDKEEKEDDKKFYHYSDEYREEKPREESKESDKDDYYSDAPRYASYYTDERKNDDYTQQEKPQEANEEDDVDLYEKFVRERFGKRGSFEKRSEKLREDSTRPAPENIQLYNTLKKVLKKTEKIHKDAEKSGDPNAGYMWTLEYGQNL